MRRNRSVRRWISAGTLVMLSITFLVLAGFATLLPTLTGNQDIRLDAARLAVAIDTSFSQLTATADRNLQKPQQLLPKIVWSSSITPTSVPPQHVQTSAPVATATPVPKRSFSLCATGSILFNTQVLNALTFDKTYRLELLTDQIKNELSADLSIATLENTLIPEKRQTDVNQPADILVPIRETGVNALCLGHASALNGGIAGLRASMQAVKDAGIQPYGLRTAANQPPVILNLNGVNVALLSFQDEVSPNGRKECSEEERSFAFTPIQLPMIANEISAARAAGAQVIVVSLCWGKEDSHVPDEQQQKLAQEIANAGADIILGTRSSALQPVQVLAADRDDGRYHPVLCAYSLGDFFSHDRDKRAHLASILLKATVVYDPVNETVAFDDLSYTPTYAWRGKVDGKTLYRVLLNNGNTPPAFVSEDQKGVMDRCYTLVTEIMSDTGIPQKQ